MATWPDYNTLTELPSLVLVDLQLHLRPSSPRFSYLVSRFSLTIMVRPSPWGPILSEKPGRLTPPDVFCFKSEE